MSGNPFRQVLIVTPTFLPEPIGTPLYATDLARALSDAGYRVTVLTAQPFYPEFKRYPGYGRPRREESIEGFRIRRVATIVPRGGRPIWRAVSDINFFIQAIVVRLRRSVLPAPLVISISPGTPLVALVGRMFRGRCGRHVVLVHDIQTGLATQLGLLGTRLGWLARWIEAKCLNRADQIHVLTAEMGRAIRSLGVIKPMAVTPIWTTIDTGEPMSASREALVQYSGNLGRKQGIDQLITVARRLATVLPGERLIIRGSGQLLPSVKRALARDNIDNVVFASLVPDRDLRQALSATPIHLVPQQPGTAAYAMPSKIVNALAAGGIVIVSGERDSAPHRLSLQTPAVRWVEIGDSDAMVQQIVGLAAHPEIMASLALEAVAFARREFDRSRLLGRLLESTTLSGEVGLE